MPRWPWWQATTIGVSPSLSALSASAFAASSFATISVWPFWQAMNSGVPPSVAGLVHVGVRSEQLRDDLGVALLAGLVQRRAARGLSTWFTSAIVKRHSQRAALVTTSARPLVAGDDQRRDHLLGPGSRRRSRRAAP